MLNGIELPKMTSVTAHSVLCQQVYASATNKSVGSLLAWLLFAMLYMAKFKRFPYCQDEEYSATCIPSVYLWYPVVNIIPISRAAPPASGTTDTDLGETDRFGEKMGVYKTQPKLEGLLQLSRKQMWVNRRSG